jgi:hypothetical protein
VLVSPATETEGSPHIDRESLKLLVRPVTASNGWRADELSTIDGNGEVDIATVRRDGTTAAWYRGVQTGHEGELSAGRLKRGKYGRSSSAVAASPQTSPARRPCVDPA